jgi:predicted Rossmann fold flavoprotein
MSKVVVIGGGPAGMMAAIAAADKHEVVLLESNDRLGKKLYITGKGRCNVTNAKDISEFFNYIPGNPHFMYSSLYTFTNEDTMNFFNELGVELKIERGDRVFPKSDKSSDIINAFTAILKKKNVDVRLKSRVKKVYKTNDAIDYILLEDDTRVKGDYFIISTGGVSYPLTGSKGDGIAFARELGHNIIKPKPSLVPIELKETWIKELQGLSLKNVKIKILENKKILFEDFGEMLFTHFGISGPIVLSASRVVNDSKPQIVSINLKPALTEDELDKRIQKDFQKYINKDFKNSLDDLLPQKLIDVIIRLSQIEENKKVNSVTREERLKLVKLIQNLEFSIKGLRPVEEAIVTAGGVDTKEIDPSTMKSKLINNLYFAGEVIDVDAYTGGYNIQIALSTGYLAGKNISS